LLAFGHQLQATAQDDALERLGHAGGEPARSCRA
jgi:hypothetical protein